MKKVILALFLSTAAYAEQPTFSLFLTEEEQALHHQVLPATLKKNSGKQLCLKAIMMFDEEQWTIWINEHRITPDSCPDHMEVQSVSDSGVLVTLKTEHGPQNIHLKINEPYVLEDGDGVPKL